MIRHAIHAARNAFFSPGFKRFGFGFSRDYLRLAWRAARRWGSVEPGEMRFLGRRIPFANQTHAVTLVHELFVNCAYTFNSPSAAPRVIDAGANIGMAVVFFKALYPDARITAYEPDETAFAMLGRLVEENGMSGVRVVHAAVGERGGTATLYHPPGDRAGIVTSLDREWGGAAEQTVRVVRLSDEIDGPVDLLKLDVEGAEYGVIRDLAASGRMRDVREIVMEYHDVSAEPGGAAELARLLEDGGMVVQRVTHDASGRTGLLRARRGDAAGAASSIAP